VIRGVILVLFWPLLQRWGYGITAREGVVLAWCGQPSHKSNWRSKASQHCATHWCVGQSRANIFSGEVVV